MVTDPDERMLSWPPKARVAVSQFRVMALPAKKPEPTTLNDAPTAPEVADKVIAADAALAEESGTRSMTPAIAEIASSAIVGIVNSLELSLNV